ncbi:MAG: transposase [Acidobacteriota bacterium]
MIEAWAHFDRLRYDLVAAVVMPNHVHVMIRVREAFALSKIVQSWKSYTGRWIAEHFPEAVVRTEQGRRVWMRDYWDRYIRDEVHYAEAVAYISENPVRAGLVKRVDDWPWRVVGQAELELGGMRLLASALPGPLPAGRPGPAVR